MTGTTEDSVVAAGVIFQCFGAMLVDANGKITVKSDAVRQALAGGRRRSERSRSYLSSLRSKPMI
jgi:hypothetical protein